MKMKLKLALLLFALPLGGCVVAAVGAAAYGIIKIENNEALRDYKATTQATWDAAKAEMKDAGYPPKNDVALGEAKGNKLEADGAWVKVEPLEDGFTRVRVSIGTFETEGNIDKARGILNGIARRLGEPEY